MASPGHMFGIGRDVRLGLVAFVALLVFGTVGFRLTGGADWSLFDAFYMTVITVSTVGYHEVHELGAPGRVVALLVIFFGVGIVLFVAGSTAEALLAGALFRRRHVARAIRRMSDHFIVCGYGRVGQAICRELEAQGTPFVVVDIEPIELEHAPSLEGDATDDETLRTAGIERCRGLVSVLGKDADNIYTVLAARSLRREVLIVARCGQERSRRKLEAAGADRVVNPYLRGGLLLARILVRPQVVDFLEEVSMTTGLDVLISEAEVLEASRLAGLALKDSGIRQELDIIVTAIVKQEGRKIFNPSPTERIEPGDVLISMGRPRDLDRLVRVAAGSTGMD